MSSKPLSKQLSGTIDPSGRPLARTSEGPVTGSFHSQSEFSRSVAPKDIFQVISPDLSMVGVCSPSLSLWVLKQVDNMGGWYVYVCICSLSLSLSLLEHFDTQCDEVSSKLLRDCSHLQMLPWICSSMRTQKKRTEALKQSWKQNMASKKPSGTQTTPKGKVHSD